MEDLLEGRAVVLRDSLKASLVMRELCSQLLTLTANLPDCMRMTRAEEKRQHIAGYSDCVRLRLR